MELSACGSSGAKICGLEMSAGDVGYTGSALQLYFKVYLSEGVTGSVLLVGARDSSGGRCTFFLDGSPLNNSVTATTKVIGKK